MAEAALAGIGVLVTRPRHQASGLISAIESEGGTAFAFPTIEIVPRASEVVRTEVRSLRSPDIVIFVSPNAVQHGLIHADSAAIAAVGPTTTAAIESAGKTVDIRSATGYDSEHLLLESGLANVDGMTIRIIRGGTGRELLADTLKERGATVEYLSVYDRIAPDYSADDLSELETQWRSGAINVVTIMSVESLTNLIILLPQWCNDQLRQTPLVTPAVRVIKEAVDRLHNVPTALARGPQASEMVRAITDLGPIAAGQP